ncbi:Nuclear transcription factor Y subunit C-2 [Senna tora]|uniref:Nuclear transcription factor Y subunit C-2 n=1 Tax=Senna tora TaxID=362788 RepID=A0A834WJU2_9FABA|nr:Nuclear transcription factor Y subunit C-2 [Senna tora]
MENQKMNASSISAPSSPELGLSISPTRMGVDFDDLEILNSTEESRVVLKKATEIFIEELSLRAWVRTGEKNKNTLERNDFAEEINENKVYDFLVDIVPMDPNDHPSNVKDFGSTENFNQQPLTDLSNIINQPPFQQNQALEMFWQQQLYEIQNAEAIRGQNQLPLARIKRIMMSDSDVKMISAETPILLSKACEMFIQEMSLRAWMRTDENKRRTIQHHDVAESIHEIKLYDFLTDVIPLQYQGGHPSLAPPPQPQPQEEHSRQAAENPNYAAPIVDESLMNMEINVTDQQAESSQKYIEAFTMDPSIVPPHPQLPYDFPPPN